MALPIRKPNLLLPNKNINLNKWSVIACDQFTSDEEYWNKLFDYVGGSRSTLYLIYPEAFLNKGNQEQYITKINQTMLDYQNDGTFIQVDDYLLTVRDTVFGNKRIGLMVLVDLDCYDPFGKLEIRATERTVKERLPIRVKIRENASLELPHILVLIDDKDKEVIEPAYNGVKEEDLLYSFELNNNGGFVKGYRVKDSKRIEDAIRSVAKKHQCNNDLANFYLAVGDGNHSLASARECWLKVKSTLSPDEMQNHPQRYALVELVNLYDEGVKFEPIHRIVKNPSHDFLCNLDQNSGREINVIENNQYKTIRMNGTAPEIIANVQNYIDNYISTHEGCYQDYLHGIEHTENAVADGGVAIFLPQIDKNTFFKYIDENGVLTRKAFSMGEAEEKRYYLEARAIKK